MREINVSPARDPVHAGDKALTRETPAKRGRVKRYACTVGLVYWKKQLCIEKIKYKFNKCSQSTCILQVDTLSQMA